MKSDSKTEIKFGHATKYFVCVGLEWENITAAALYKIFDSVLPYSEPKYVKIFVTNYGKQLLNKEEAEYDKKKCYVALAKFRSVEDAIQVYNYCDNISIENTKMVFDIRFVDNDKSFEECVDESYSSNDYNHNEFIRKLKFGNDEDNIRADKISKISLDDVDYEIASKYIDMSDDEETPQKIVFESESEEEDKKSVDEIDSEEDMNKMVLAGLKKKNKEVRKQEKEESDNKSEVSIQEVKKSKKTKKSKKKKRKSEEEEDDFKFNEKDERFGEIYDDDDFAIDPTHPAFKEKSGLKGIIEEKKKRKMGNID